MAWDPGCPTLGYLCGRGQRSRIAKHVLAYVAALNVFVMPSHPFSSRTSTSLAKSVIYDWIQWTCLWLFHNSSCLDYEKVYSHFTLGRNPDRGCFRGGCNKWRGRLLLHLTDGPATIRGRCIYKAAVVKQTFMCNGYAPYKAVGAIISNQSSLNWLFRSSVKQQLKLGWFFSLEILAYLEIKAFL